MPCKHIQVGTRAVIVGTNDRPFAGPCIQVVKTFIVFFIAISGVLRNKVGARSVESRLSNNSMVIQCVTGDEFNMRALISV